ncbi:MAG: nucleotide exchange factor GrpE [Promethearchaeota archaeon]
MERGFENLFGLGGPAKPPYRGRRDPGVSTGREITKRELAEILEKARAFEKLRGVVKGLVEERDSLAKERDELAARLETSEKLQEELEAKNSRLQSELEVLRSKLVEANESAEKHLKALRRVQADYDNYRKVVSRRVEETKRFAAEGILRRLLDLNDDFQRLAAALETRKGQEQLKRGVALIRDNLEKILKDEGVRPIEALGKKFDPRIHEAIDVEHGGTGGNSRNEKKGVTSGDDREDAALDDTVVEVYNDGYYYHDKVLRPARVKVRVGNRTER